MYSKYDINSNKNLYSYPLPKYSTYTYGSFPHNSYIYSLQPKTKLPSIAPSIAPSITKDSDINSSKITIILITVFSTSSILFIIFFFWYRAYKLKYKKMKEEIIEEFGIDISQYHDF
jgi:hypothetical protein